MKFTLTLASLVLALGAAPSWAQTISDSSVPSVSAASKKKKAHPKKARKASHGSEATPVAAPTAVAAATPGLAPLNEAQLELAKNVQTGDIGCEDKVRVKVVPLPDAPGYFHVQIGVKERFEMMPVPTQTGAVRLEDPQRGGVWIQLPAKSMLMNTKLGQRMADACRTPAQEAVEAAVKINPPPDLLDPQPEVVQR